MTNVSDCVLLEDLGTVMNGTIQFITCLRFVTKAVLIRRMKVRQLGVDIYRKGSEGERERATTDLMRIESS